MSNLLKEASILLTPTAYDNGRMLSVKPIPLYGSELVTNGDFSNGTNDWEVEGFSSIIIGSYEGKQNVANINIGNTSSNSRIRQSFNYVSGKKYKVSVSVYLVSGSFRVDSSDSFVSEDFVSTSSIGSWVTLNGVINATSTGSNYIWLRSNSEISNFYVESISIKEVSDGDLDFSRNSSATRVNAQGLVENVQILSSNLVSNGNFSQEGVQEVSNGSFSQEGSEQVTNGDFDTDSDWVKQTGWSISDSTANYNGVSSVYIQQANVFNANTKYKLTFTVSNNTSGIISFRDGLAATLIPNTNYSNGIHTFYITSNTNTSLRIYGVGGSGSVSIDNVSVKEVGQDWAFSSGASLTDLGAKITHTPTAGSIGQVNVLVIGKQYKLTYEITESVSGGLKFNSAVNASMVTTVGVHTKYFEADATTAVFSRTDSSNNDVTITNLSVKEVGQNWAINGADFSLGSVLFDNSNDNIFQNKPFTVGSKYRLSFEGSGDLAYRTGYAGADGVKKDITLPHTVDIIATSDTNRLQPYGASNNAQGTLTNITLKEITDDTNLPRINYEGFSYQDSLGSEEVVNGDFATDTNWIKNGQVTIGGGVAYFDSDGTFTQIAQSISGVSGKNVKVVIEITEYTQGTLKVLFSGGTQQNLPNSIGVHTLYFNNADSDTINIARLGGVTNLKIDNVSVKEYLGQEVVPNSGCGSWLLEPQSTNLIPYSEDFSQWGKQQVTVTSNNSISPDGSLNADKLTAYGTDPFVQYYVNSTSITNSLSIWAKGVGSTIGKVCKIYAVRDSYAEAVPQSFTLTSEWQRFEATLTFSAAPTSTVAFRFDAPNVAVIGDESYIYGAQLEQKSYPTSYIPTSGATSTRLRDIANNSGNASLINSSEGVLYFEGSALAGDGTFRLLSFSDGTSVNRVYIGYSSVDGITCSFQIASSAVYGFDFTTDINVNSKLALKYKENDFALWVNGVEVNSQSSGNTFPIGTLTKMQFTSGTVSSPFYGKNKGLAVFKTALTDSSLRCLTYPPAVATTFDLDFDTIAEQFTFTRGSEATFVNAQGLIQSTNEIGSELVTNGSFATDSANWFLTGTSFWVNSSIEVPTGGLTQAFTLENNKTYKITFDVIQGSGINGGVYVNTNYNSPVFADNVGVTTTGVGGTYTFIFTMNGSGNGIMLTRRVNNQDIRIDNVSVKEHITATNTPRLDYSTGAEAFLLEPQSTNLITQSELFSDSSWTKSELTESLSDINSPDGTQNAYKLTESNSSSKHQIFRSIPSYTQLTISFFAKKAERSFISVEKSGWGTTVFNLNDGSVVSGTGSVVDFGNGWYRCSASYIASPAQSQFYILLMQDGSTTSYQGDGTSGLYLFGVQAESLPYATSYIPTSGASATRNQELCNNATPVINSEEGTLYAEISALSNDGTSKYITLSNGTNTKRIIIATTSTSNQVRVQVVDTSSQIEIFNTLSDITTFNKLAFSYKQNEFKFYVNGVLVGTDTSGSVPSGLNVLKFSNADNNVPFFGNTKGLKYYPKALADVQLQDLTSWGSFAEMANALNYTIK